MPVLGVGRSLASARGPGVDEDSQVGVRSALELVDLGLAAGYCCETSVDGSLGREALEGGVRPAARVATEP